MALGIEDARPVAKPAGAGARRTGVRIPRADPEPQPLNRAQAVESFLQMIAFGVRFISPIDGASIALHAAPIGAAAAETAANDKKFAAFVDRIVMAGPYGILLAAIAPLGLQIAANRGLIESGTFGTLTEDQLAAELARLSSEETEESPNGDSPPNT